MADHAAGVAHCLFCRIVRGEIPAKVVVQSAQCIAIRDIDPQAPVHVVIIPRAHVATLNGVKDPLQLGQMAEMATMIARHEDIDESGYRTVINTNADGGQTVFHLHMHVLGGRGMTWPPG